VKQSRITLIYIDSGGGHRAAATALTEVIHQQNRPWSIEMVCIQDLLDSIDFIRKFTGIRFQEVYNIMLRHGWTAGTAQLTPVAHGLIRLSHDTQVKVLEPYWKENRPDLVVSLIPHYNRSLKQALDRAWPNTPYVTLLTDIADYPPHFWIERMEQWVICGSRKAVEQAREIGIRDERILAASGMILNPNFYKPLQIDRVAGRLRLGLSPDLPTGLVLFGGEGSSEMVRIVKALDQQYRRLQLILICGRNEALAAELRSLDSRMRMHVEGFTREIPMFMELSDFFIGKPGPGSISEALHKNLPVLVQRNAWTMAHERYNADWVGELGAGIVMESFSRELSGAIDTLLAPANYARYRQAAAAVQNRAVYEIPDMLSGILNSAAVPQWAPSGGWAVTQRPSPGSQRQRHPGAGQNR
jgi:Glycosyltransferase family 28 C-terminal domain